jgi:hypothetical protein
LRGKARDTVQAAKAEIRRETGKEAGEGEPTKSQQAVSDRLIRATVRHEPDLYPSDDD